jgi:CBS domain containing-hemolysin-like protein
VGDGVDWHGARFVVRAMQDERITSVSVSLKQAS